MYTSIWPKQRYALSERFLQVLVGTLFLLIEFFVIGPMLLGQSTKGVLAGTVIFGVMVAVGITTLATLPIVATALLLYSALGCVALLLGMSYAK